MKRVMIACIASVLALVFPAKVWAETIGVFFEADVEQIKFAAGDIKAALERNQFTVEMLPLASLNVSYPNKKIVVALASNTAVIAVLTAQGGSKAAGLGEQAYGLRTTENPQKSYWALGGDMNGAMYGGLQIAENIKFNQFTGTYNNEESPAILKRGIKLNLPWDKNSGTYGKRNKGTFDGTSAQLAVADVWDMSFWTAWFDEMARHRYNTVSLWSCNPFSSLVSVPGYEDCSIQNVTEYNGKVTPMTIDQKIKFWKDVMAYAHARGFEFLIFNWNIFTYGATGKHGITDGKDGATDPDTRDYLYKAMKQLLETYPDLDGFGLSIGENNGTEDFVWETFGKAMHDYAATHPQRKLKFIHRLHYGDFDDMLRLFEPLRKCANVSFDISVKHSQAHMYSTATPNWWPDEYKKIKDSGLKTWLTVRNDTVYYLTWGDPDYARVYIDGMLKLGGIFKGFYMGSDGYNPTRAFFSRNKAMNGQLEVQRQQYMMMIWGRLSYNPGTPDEVFKNYMSFKYPAVSADSLFKAWRDGSRGVQLATEMIGGTYQLDFKWWPEACACNGGFRTVSDFAGAKVTPGSLLCSIEKSASGNLGGKKSSYDVADEMEQYAQSALSMVATMKADTDSELGVAINNIKAMSYLSLYYANKIRGATYLKVGPSKDVAKGAALGEAYCWWMKYSNLMDAMFTGMQMQRVPDIENWHSIDADVLKEYTSNGGVGIPLCEEKNTK
jgi:hypothetical protein